MISTKKITLLSFILFFAIPMSFIVRAQHEPLDSEETHEQHGDAHQQKKFEPGPFIFDHIGDAREWHITTIGKTHITIPLPVILYSEEKGLNVFMSSRFEHGHSEYKGFKIDTEKGSPTEGKIIEMLQNGETSTPIDISITKNVFALFISVALLMFIFISVAKSYEKNKGKAPKGLQSFLEPIILFVRDDIAKSSIQKNHERFVPFLLTIFFFIFFNNLLGLVPIFPGGANLTGNITVTMVLALFTFVITTFVGNKGYWTHIVNTPGAPWWLKIPVPLMPLVELIGVFTKPFVLMIRLFANMTAGHAIALGFYSLIFTLGGMSVYAGYGSSVLAVAFMVFMTLLELLVAFIQAYVFTLLSALYFGMATEEHH